jgi:hypothetical protein
MRVFNQISKESSDHGWVVHLASWFLMVQGLEGMRKGLFDDKDGIIDTISGDAIPTGRGKIIELEMDSRVHPHHRQTQMPITCSHCKRYTLNGTRMW